MSDDLIENAILTLAEQRGPGKSICPSEAAREAFPEDWQGRMRHVRAAAVHLARKGQVMILRKGKPVDPENFKGVYRITIAPVSGDEPS
jgi:hypothetical protein